VSGYFDGDGNVGLEVARHVLRFRMRFIDTWFPQVEAIRRFLTKEKLVTTTIVAERAPGRNDAYRLEITAISSFLKAAKAMLPFCVKKREDLGIAIDYLEDKITGNEALARFNMEVVQHRRAGYIRELNMPLAKSGGIRTKQLENARKARAAYAVVVPDDVQAKIRQDHNQLRLGYVRLVRKYGYSQSVIRRVLGRP
jgi:hypothetical protein